MRNLHRTLRPESVYFILSGVSAFADATMWTVGTVYYVTAVGLNPLQLVLVGTVLETTYFLFEVPTGVVADTYSRRLSVIIGMLLLGAAFVLVGAAPLFLLVLFGQVISGIGYTFLSGATEAWLADEVGEENVGRIYLRSAQLSRLLGLAGTAASVALASIALNAPFIVGGVLYLALGVFLALGMSEHGFRPAPRGERTSWGAMGRTFREGAQQVRRSPVLLTLFAVGVFAGAASEGFDRLGDAHLLANFRFPALGALKPVVWFGIIDVTISLICLAVNELFRRRLEVTTRNPIATARILLFFNLLSIASIIAFGLAGNFNLAFGALIVKAVAGSLIGPLYNAWLVQNIRPSVRATVISMIGQADSLGQIAGGPGVGLVGTVFSLRAAIVLTGTLLSPISLLYARVLRRGKLEALPSEV